MFYTKRDNLPLVYLDVFLLVYVKHVKYNTDLLSYIYMHWNTKILFFLFLGIFVALFGRKLTGLQFKTSKKLNKGAKDPIFVRIENLDALVTFLDKQKT